MFLYAESITELTLIAVVCHDGRTAWLDENVCARGTQQHVREPQQGSLAWNEQIQQPDTKQLLKSLRRVQMLKWLPSSTPKQTTLAEGVRSLPYGTGTPPNEGLGLLATQDENTHDKVNWLCSHPTLRWLLYALTPILSITSQSGWGRNSICSSTFYTAFTSAGAKQFMFFCAMGRKFQK